MNRLGLSRLHWRLRGAWQWPAFTLAVAAETVLLDALPVWGDGPGGFWGGLLLAGCLNLIVVAVLAPLAGRLLRLRRPDLPRLIATDYAGAASLVRRLVGTEAQSAQTALEGLEEDVLVEHSDVESLIHRPPTSFALAARASLAAGRRLR
jgi:hypothetical protein